MKDTELKKLLEGKDLSKAEDFTAVLTGINNDANSTISKRDETIEVLKKENEALKGNAKLFANEKEELSKKAVEATNVVDVLTKKLYIAKNINNKLEEEDENDLLTLTASRMNQNKDAKFEDVINAVAEKRQFKLGGQLLPPAPKANKAPANNNPKEEKVGISKEDALSFFGITSHK